MSNEHLTTGGMSGSVKTGKIGTYFSYPGPVYVPGVGYTSDGMVWMSCRPMVGQDIKNLNDTMKTQDVLIDPASEVGLLHKDWDARQYQGKRNAPGGWRSDLYKLEHVYWGVSFTERPTWLHSEDGEELVKERSEGTPFHTENIGDGHKNLIRGPKPKTGAYKLLKEGGSFKWDEDALRWRMYDKSGKVIHFNRHQQYYDLAEELGKPIED